MPCVRLRRCARRHAAGQAAGRQRNGYHVLQGSRQACHTLRTLSVNVAAGELRFA